MKATFLRALLLSLAAGSALAQTTGNNGIGGSGGVSQILAGSNVTLSPTNGRGTVTVTASSTASTAWSALTSGTNTSLAGVCGTGCSLGFSGSGIINANEANGVAFSVFATASSISVSDSITGAGTSGSPLSLSGDSASPGDSMCYGTNSSGVKGWYACSSGSSTAFQANGTGLSSSTTVNFENSAATNGLTLTFTNPSAGNVQLGFTGTLSNAGLANSATTVNSQTCTLGSTCTIPFDTNSAGNTSQAGLNLETSTTNAVGLTVTPTNSATNVEKFEVTGGSYSGTAANLSGTPALPNGTTATTQTTGDNTTKLATDAFVLANAASAGVASVAAGGGIAVTGTGSGPYTGAVTVSANAPNRTVTSSPTVASTDMGGQINSNVSGGGTLTIPAISSTVFPANSTLTVVNYSASTEAVSTTPTVNAGGGCVSGTGIPAGATWNMISNGTTLDCNQSVSAGGGSGIVNGGTSGQVAYYASTGAAVSGETTLTAPQMPALTGDCTSTSGTVATTCTKINGTTVPSGAGMVSTTSSGQIQAQAVVAATAATGPTNDYSPSGFGTTTAVLYLTPTSGGSTLDGLVAQNALQQVYIVNAEAAGGADNILLVNQSSSDSTAANRFLTSATSSLAIPPGGRVLCVYLPSTVSRWSCQ